MDGIKIKLEFVADIDVLRQVLKERGLEANVTNMKKVANFYKERQYSIKDKKFFDDFPMDKETLLMYGFRTSKFKEEK